MKRSGGGRFSEAEIDRIRSDTRISDIIGRFVSWDQRKSNPGRGDMWACCPFHGEKNPSFHVEDQKGRYHCFGCGVSGDVFRFLTEKAGMTFPQAVADLGGRPDDIKEDPAIRAQREEQAAARRRRDAATAERKAKNVRELAHDQWREARPLADSLGERYLRGRGADFALDFPALRFHPAAELRIKGELVGRHPALFAAVQAPDDLFLGIWRIFLTPEGENLRDADGKKLKLGLGAYTEAGGGVRLGKPVGRVNVVEGIETGMGVYGILGGAEPVLCALNTTGMRTLKPPPSATRFLVWPDGDVDKIRSIVTAGEARERKIPSPGITAARELKATMAEAGFPCGVQATPKNGRDYLDAYNATKQAITYG